MSPRVGFAGVGRRGWAWAALAAATVMFSLTISNCGGKGEGGKLATRYTVTARAGSGGSVSPGTAAVAAGDTARFTVHTDANHAVSDIQGCAGKRAGNSYVTGPVRGDCTVAADFRVLSLNISGQAGEHGSIAPVKATVLPGQSTRLSLTPDTDYAVNEVNGCPGKLVNNIYITAPLTEDCVLTASFSAAHHVSVLASKGGEVSPTTQNIKHGGNAIFNLHPISGYKLAAISGCGGILSGSTYVTGEVLADCDIDASFQPLSYVVRATAGAGGTIVPQTTEVSFGETRNFRVTADSNFVIDKITGCEGSLQGNTYTTGKISAECSIAVTFNYKESGAVAATPAALADGAAGNSQVSDATTTRTGSGQGGQTAAFNAPAQAQPVVAAGDSAPGRGLGPVATVDAANNDRITGSFAGYSLAGGGSGDSKDCGADVPGPVTATTAGNCLFNARATPEFTVSAVAGVGGSITPEAQTVKQNRRASFDIIPAAGFSIAEVSGCNGNLAGSTYTTQKIGANCTVNVSFRLIRITVSAGAAAHGSVSPQTVSADWGQRTSFRVQADEGYAINHVAGCGGHLDGDLYTTGPLTEDCVVSAYFGLPLPAVTPLYPRNGADWNDYVKNDGANRYSASDTATDGGEAGGYSAVLHGGEMRSLALPGINGCGGLSAQDDLEAFTWVCLAGNPARIVSAGLRPDRNLTDLIAFNAAAWKPNRVTVLYNGMVYGQSPATAWWRNSVIVDNDGSDGNDMTPGDVRIISAGSNQSYRINKSKIALVVLPTLELTAQITTPDPAPYPLYHLWLEGKFTGSGDTLVALNDVNFSVLRNLRTRGGGIGVALRRSYNNLLRRLAMTAARSGLQLAWSTFNSIVDGMSAGNHTGVEFYQSSRNSLLATRLTDNDDGINFDFRSANNTVAGALAAGNHRGIVVNGDGNLLLGSTVANNFNGVYISAASNTLSELLAVNCAHGLELSDSSAPPINNLVNDFTATQGDIGIILSRAQSNIFSGELRLGNTVNCALQGGVAPGLDGDCKPQGDSDFNLATGLDLSAAFVGKVLLDDAVNASDNDGAAASPIGRPAFDWSGFENSARIWGRDGSAFPAGDQRDRWTGAAVGGRIWDWSLRASDRAARWQNPLPTGSDILRHTWTDGGTISFLRYALELSGDGVGNDNGLCESGETCVYTPNLGTYQGHGNLIATGGFSDGAVKNVTLLRYESNGR